VTRRLRLNETQIAELYEPPTEQRELVRHFTLSAADLAAIRRCRGDHNRLGYALMLSYLRFPGRTLRARERPPASLLAFVAEQIDVLPDRIDAYLAVERNRQRHAIECQERLGLRPFGTRPAAELTEAAGDRGRPPLRFSSARDGSVPRARDRHSLAGIARSAMRPIAL